MLRGTSTGCSDTFGFSSNVNLTATPDWKSVFGSWGGACASSANPCSLTALASDRSVSLSFAPNYQAILAGAPATGYNTLQSAYNATVNGSTILAHVHDFYEDLIFNQARAITLDGGKAPNDSSYQTTTGYTSVVGTLSIASGKVTIKNIIIK